MPRFEAPPIPPKNESGTLMTSAHGQLMTRKISARRTQSAQPPPSTIGGNTANASAAITTAGVYQRANFVMKFSALAFFSPAFSTRSSILATVDSPYGFSTRTRKSPLPLMQPLMTVSPSAVRRGTLSPVRAAVSIMLLPSSTVPSSGTRSPGFTRMTSHT